MNILLNHYVIIALRLIHITSGVLWVGSGLLFIGLLLPAVKESGSAGQTVMQKFGPRFGPFMGIVTTATVISGALLYSRFFITTGLQWILTTGSGLGFTIGALAGISSYILGTSVFGPTQEKIGALGAEMAAAEKPSEEQISRMHQLQLFLMKVYKVDVVLLVVALFSMAVARYL